MARCVAFPLRRGYAPFSAGLHERMKEKKEIRFVAIVQFQHFVGAADDVIPQ